MHPLRPKIVTVHLFLTKLPIHLIFCVVHEKDWIKQLAVFVLNHITWVTESVSGVGLHLGIQFVWYPKI